MNRILAQLPKGRKRDLKGQMPLWEQQKRTRPRRGEPRGNRLSQAERRVAKATALRLCNHAYAVLCNQPELVGERDIKGHKRSIGHFIGLHRKGRLTFLKAQAAIGAATSLLDKAGVKYEL